MQYSLIVSAVDQLGETPAEPVTVTVTSSRKFVRLSKFRFYVLVRLRAVPNTAGESVLVVLTAST